MDNIRITMDNIRIIMDNIPLTMDNIPLIIRNQMDNNPVKWTIIIEFINFTL